MAAQQIVANVIENQQLGPETSVLRLSHCHALKDTLPGHFVMLRASDWGVDPLLPRAFSLLRVLENGEAEFLIKGTGKACAQLTRSTVGDEIHLLGPLGSCFPDPQAGREDWLVAGGVGLAPLLMYAIRAKKLNLSTGLTMFYGGRTASDIVLQDLIRDANCAMKIATEDGSLGVQGYVTNALDIALQEYTKETPPTLMVCGPEPMLEACARLAHERGLEAYLSVEGEMACGIGACLACAVPCYSKAYRYACVDGPVFALGDLAGAYAHPDKKGARS